jgi:hypothetical protein
MDALTVFLGITAFILIISLIVWVFLGMFVFLGSLMLVDRDEYLEDPIETKTPKSRKKK